MRLASSRAGTTTLTPPDGAGVLTGLIDVLLKLLDVLAQILELLLCGLVGLAGVGHPALEVVDASRQRLRRVLGLEPGVARGLGLVPELTDVALEVAHGRARGPGPAAAVVLQSPGERHARPGGGEKGHEGREVGPPAGGLKALAELEALALGVLLLRGERPAAPRGWDRACLHRSRRIRQASGATDSGPRPTIRRLPGR